MLLMFGKIHGPLTNGAWTYFEISLPGMEFMEDGGFEGRRKRKDYKADLGECKTSKETDGIRKGDKIPRTHNKNT